ncbi:MAG: hypothetical protein H6669_04780 [Ardenticatenaceae bacterium]|nr:hypothetical protein [Ardenticatenaceae bacterium]
MRWRTGRFWVNWASWKRQVDKKAAAGIIFWPDWPPILPDGLMHHELDAGRWLVYLENGEATAVINTLDLNRLDDFRLHSATLEDLYLHYTVTRNP